MNNNEVPEKKNEFLSSPNTKFTGFGTSPANNPTSNNNMSQPSIFATNNTQNVFVKPPADPIKQEPVEQNSIFSAAKVVNPVQIPKAPVIQPQQNSIQEPINNATQRATFVGYGANVPVKNEPKPVVKEEPKQNIISTQAPQVTPVKEAETDKKFVGVIDEPVNTEKKEDDYVSIFRTGPKEQIPKNKPVVDEKTELPKTSELPKPETVPKEEETPYIIMTIEDLMKSSYSEKVELEKKTKKANKWFFRLSVLSGAAFAAVLLFAIFGKTNVFNFIGTRVYYQDKKVTATGAYTTAVVVDNKYKVAFNEDEDEREQAVKYIVQDSDNQKKKCTNEEVKLIETEIEEKYGITAVNFCEMDVEFAKEIRDMIGTVYKEFPMIKSELTNLTLDNMEDATGVIASFNAAFKFADSNRIGGYPKIYKMMISLNSGYFLDDSLQEQIRNNANSNYFPTGATRTSIVAHEFGHYLSFLAQLHNSDMDKLMLITRKDYRSYVKVIEESNDGTFSLKILKEALNNYNEKYGEEFSDLEDFRNSISIYAAAYDQAGNPIYDETIAESFHDYYINRDNACRASLEVMEVLKKYLSN